MTVKINTKKDGQIELTDEGATIVGGATTEIFDYWSVWLVKCPQR